MLESVDWVGLIFAQEIKQTHHIGDVEREYASPSDQRQQHPKITGAHPEVQGYKNEHNNEVGNQMQPEPDESPARRGGAFRVFIGDRRHFI